MILCDLPYGTTACKWDTVIPFEPLWAQYKRLIKDNGAIVLTASQPFTSALVMSNPGWFKYELIWEKQKGCNPLLAKKQIMKAHENVLLFYSKQPTYNPQFESGIPYIRKGDCSVKSENYGLPKNKIYDLGSIDGKRYPKSVLKYASEGMNANNLHPTQKPVALFEYLIRTYTNEGDTVLDNCAGSFTTAIACINTNRNYICIEKDEKYFEIGKNRIENHQPLLQAVNA
jgi:site-specific DNA-methyltransferase (adenine-specific)